MEERMKQIIQDLHCTNEYLQYKSLLRNLKQQPELYRRVGEYRRKNVCVQMLEGEEFIRQNNDLQNEYQDLLTNGPAQEFIIAEHQYCGMVKRLERIFLEGADVDVSFFEEESDK